MRRIACFALLLTLAACRADVPSGRYACDRDDDCPPSQTCRAGLCEADPIPPDASLDLGLADAARADGGAPDATITEGGVVDGGTTDAGCVTRVVTLPVGADTTLRPDICLAENHQGAELITRTDVGRPLYRFTLPVEVETAFSTGSIRELSLHLTRFTDASPTGPCEGSCPASAGTLTARPVRPDWDEGSDGSPTYMPNAGADWCRRTGGSLGGERWGADGASEEGSDVLAVAGSVAVDATQPTVDIPLDASIWAASTSFYIDKLSVQLLDATHGSASFLAWSREGSAEHAAQLRVAFCVP